MASRSPLTMDSMKAITTKRKIGKSTTSRISKTTTKTVFSNPVLDDIEPDSMYWDDTEDSEGYKEDGCPWIYTE